MENPGHDFTLLSEGDPAEEFNGGPQKCFEQMLSLPSFLLTWEWYVEARKD